jgi:hypothetical protein
LLTCKVFRRSRRAVHAKSWSAKSWSAS